MNEWMIPGVTERVRPLRQLFWVVKKDSHLDVSDVTEVECECEEGVMKKRWGCQLLFQDA